MRYRKITGIVFLDVEKAWETVWHKALLYKPGKASKLRYWRKLAFRYLENKTFSVSIKTCQPYPWQLYRFESYLSFLMLCTYLLSISNGISAAHCADNTAAASIKQIGALKPIVERFSQHATKMLMKMKMRTNHSQMQQS